MQRICGFRVTIRFYGAAQLIRIAVAGPMDAAAGYIACPKSYSSPSVLGLNLIPTPVFTLTTTRLGGAAGIGVCRQLVDSKHSHVRSVANSVLPFRDSFSELTS